MLKKIQLLTFLLPLFALAQNTISGTFSPAKDFKMVILYKVTPTQLVYENHSELDSLGQFNMTVKKNAEKGMYKMVYASPQEEYNFNIIYNNEAIDFTFNLNDGVKFNTSEENKIMQSYTKSMQLVQEGFNEFFKRDATNKDDFFKLLSIQKKTQEQYEAAASNKIAYQFIKANRPFFPSTYINETAYRNELKVHYFDHIDFSNFTLLNSNTLVEKSFSYVFSFLDPKTPNASYKENIDTLVKQLENNKAFKTLILELLWREFSQANETVANYITNQYLMALAKEKNNNSLIEELQVIKQTSIGAKAVNFKIDDNTNLYDLDDAENYIVVFWSSTCGHCLTELPQLQNFIKTQQQNKFKIIAFGLESETEFWSHKIKEFPKFTHIYGEGKWDNKIGNAYNVQSTPSYFILNKDKVITHKPYDVKALQLLYNSNKY